jgi:hypothetical protein
VVLTAMVVNSPIFCDKTPCGPLRVKWHFRGTCHLWNIGCLSMDYMALYLRRENSSI